MVWSRTDIKDGKHCAIHLCQSSDGTRFYRLADMDEPRAHGDDIFFTTEEVPHELLKKMNLIKISKTVKLNNGDMYYTDAHGMWFTRDEWSRLDAADLDASAIRWSTPIPPQIS